MKKALLLSGGMDSIAVAYWKRPEIAITIDYGQVCAAAEVQAATEIAKTLGIQHEILRIDCRNVGSGDLAGVEAHTQAASSEWWPYRNQLLITLAAMRLIALDVQELMIATVASDGNYRDGTFRFGELMDDLLGYQEGAMRLSMPSIGLLTQELVVVSKVPFDILAWAHSCHRANFSCGDCRGCFKHQTTMDALGHGYY